MKHICFLSSGFGREDALIVYRQGVSLVNNGFRVSYIICDEKPNEVKEGIHIYSVGKCESSMKARICKHPGYLKEYLKRFEADVYQISEPELLPLGIYLKKKGKKVVFNLREYYPDYYARKFSNKFLYKCVHDIVEFYFGYIAKKYDAVFNCMPEMTDYIRKVMPCKRFEDVANFPVVNQNFSLSYEDYCSRKNIISYFGSIYTISCQEEFLEAIQDIDDVTYLLAGVFYSKEYQQRVSSKQAWNKVKFKNGFTRDELPGIINCSVIGNVMKDFAKTETPDGSYSIIKIFETMEAGVPVLLSKVPLYEKMVEKYKCGICVDPYDVDGIKAAIEYLLHNKKEAYEMGQNGRKAVIAEFSWDSQSKAYINTIRDICNE